MLLLCLSVMQFGANMSDKDKADPKVDPKVEELQQQLQQAVDLANFYKNQRDAIEQQFVFLQQQKDK